MTTGKLSIKEMDSNGNGITEFAGYVNYDVNGTSSETTTNNATLDRYVRAIVGLTTNTYNDTEITYTYSLNDIVNGD